MSETLFPPHAYESHREQDRKFREMADEANRRFEALSEEDQMIHIIAGLVAPARELSSSMEDMLRNATQIIARTHGPKYAQRIINDPEMRKRLHLDTFTPQPPRTTTSCRTDE